MSPSPGWASIPNAFVSIFVFYILSYNLSKGMGCLSGCLLSSAFRSCFVEIAQHPSDLLMNLWGRKWSPRPNPLPSWDCPLLSPFCVFTFFRNMLCVILEPQLWVKALFSPSETYFILDWKLLGNQFACLCVIQLDNFLSQILLVLETKASCLQCLVRGSPQSTFSPKQAR